MQQQNPAGPRVWQVADHLIEQPSWGGRYILDRKGLGDDPAWAGKKVGQSYELARASRIVDPATGETHALADLVARDPAAFLGQPVVDAHGPELNLLIKLTQAKGNSFQVHLPENKTRGHWRPKPEAWFYLAPGLYTFGLKPGAAFEDYARALRAVSAAMERLSRDVQAGRQTMERAKAAIQNTLREHDPYRFINVVEAQTDDVIDLTAGGIHHSWEEDDARFPDGNLVYEVQVDVPDEACSMRGFDKGKLLDGGGLRPTHVEDYLATLETSDEHNDLAHHAGRPETVSDENGVTIEALFRTPYFWLDRVTLAPGARRSASLANGFHHVFVHHGTARAGEMTLEQGRSYLLPAALGAYELSASENERTVLLQTYLPVG